MRLKLAVLLMIFAFSVGATALPSQSRSGQRPAFEVASITVNRSVDVGGGFSNIGKRGDHVTLTKHSVRMLMGTAYDLPTLSDAMDRIIGAPSWADSEYFDIEARAEGLPDMAQKRLMLQSLLADRFKLVLHHDTRQLPVFALVMIQSGKLGQQLHLHTAKAPCEAERSISMSPRSPEMAAIAELQKYPCGRVVGGLLPNDPRQAWSGGRKVTMGMIAASLGGDESFDRPVIDATGDERMFDFTVEWHTLMQPLSTTPSSDSSGITLVGALRDQLGLKLVAQKGPVDVLVVDHVEKPTVN